MTKVYEIIVTSAHNHGYETTVFAYETPEQRDRVFDQMKRSCEEWIKDNYSEYDFDLSNPITYEGIFRYHGNNGYYFYRDDNVCEECWDLVEKHDIQTIDEGRLWSEENDKVIEG